MRAAIQAAMRPRVLLPFVLGLGVIVALVAVSNAQAVLAHILALRPLALLPFFLLMAAYEAVRCLQWIIWLRALGIPASPRMAVFSFLAGEAATFLPIGNYLRNYLLRQATGTNYGRSVPATAVTMLIEDSVALAAVALLGIPAWAWLRPTTLVVLMGLALAVGMVLALLRGARRPRWLPRYPRLAALAEEAGLFRAGALLLARPRLLALQALLGAAYLTLGGVAFFVVLRGLDISSVPFTGALAVYFFSLGVGLLAPLPLDLGVIELSGVSALLAFNVHQDVAVGAMLLLRVLSGGSALLIAGGAMLVLRRELRAALRGRNPGRERVEQPAGRG